MGASFLFSFALASLLFSAICKASSDNHFAFLHFLYSELFLIRPWLYSINIGQVSSAQSLSHVRLFGILQTAACQASLFITNSQTLLKLMSIELLMPSNHLILCHPLLLLRSIFPSIKISSNESALCIRWPKYWPKGLNTCNYVHCI